MILSYSVPMTHIVLSRSPRKIHFHSKQRNHQYFSSPTLEALLHFSSPFRLKNSLQLRVPLYVIISHIFYYLMFPANLIMTKNIHPKQKSQHTADHFIQIIISSILQYFLIDKIYEHY